MSYTNIKQNIFMLLSNRIKHINNTVDSYLIEGLAIELFRLIVEELESEGASFPEHIYKDLEE